MTTTTLTVERRGHILMMGFNRPEKRNAMTLDTYRELAAAYGELDRDPELWCGVLYGVGDHFTAGLDLTQWAPVFAAGKWPDIPASSIEPFGLDESRRCRKPVVVAARGVSFTVAIELMLAADMRVAAPDTRFGQIEVKRGFYPCGGATVRLAQEIGWGNAMDLILTGREFSGEEAQRLGFVQRLVPAAQVLDTAVALAEEICRQAPLGVQAALKLARVARVKGDEAGLKAMLPDLVPIMKTEDAREAVRAFGEKRAPVFTGR
ncbi:MAG: crotonase/enoyl-CoA hydratase family protein [Gammaproteobacteria bacterium]